MRPVLPTPALSGSGPVLRQFLQFGLVGLSGFAVDVLVVYLLRHAIGLVAAGLVAYFAAATSNWALNRAWTFRGANHTGLVRQWAMFITANGLGFLLNRGTFLLLVAFVPLCAEQPVFAVAAGVGAGLLANFNLSRRVVFR